MTSLAYIYMAATKSKAFTIEPTGPDKLDGSVASRFSQFKFPDSTVILGSKPFRIKEVMSWVDAEKVSIKARSADEYWTSQNEFVKEKELHIQAGPLCMLFNLQVVETE